MGPVLLDTHILLWTLEGSVGRMGPNTAASMRSAAMDVSVSAVSLLEIRLKQRRGGLRQFDIAVILDELQARAITLVDIAAKDIAAIPDADVAAHADPFDLLLIAQAVAENIPLLTCDDKILEIALPGLRLVDGRL